MYVRNVMPSVDVQKKNLCCQSFRIILLLSRKSTEFPYFTQPNLNIFNKYFIAIVDLHQVKSYFNYYLISLKVGVLGANRYFITQIKLLYLSN